MYLPPPTRLLLALAAACAVLLGWATEVDAQVRRIRYSFQPDCFRPSLTAACDKRRTGTRLDLGPQIAVWLESADRKRFVADLLVTRAVAVWGLGNRPGNWRLPSSPKFPYGKRLMALPVWAYARGRSYDSVVMQDGVDKEFWLGFHEAISTPDPYYCRPMSLSEIDVDAIACPTAVFMSAKGKFSRTEKSPYPPRNDLRSFTDRDCDEPNGRINSCTVSARLFADLNDLDAVATATRVYGERYAGVWTVPGDVPDGEYALALEISKEFDQNASHRHEAYTDPNLSDSGLKNNLGQPSVLYRVPFALRRGAPFQGASGLIAGYGDWDGATGALHPPDSSISDAPGSGEGRLLAFSMPASGGGAPVVGRLHVSTEVPEVPNTPEPPRDASAPGDSGIDDADAGADTDADAAHGGGSADAGAVPGVGGCPGPVLPAAVVELNVPMTGVKPESAEIHFMEPSGETFQGIEQYQVRYWEGTEQTPDAFTAGTPADTLFPVAAGEARVYELRNLKPQIRYTVGVRAAGACVSPELRYARIDTARKAFTQLSGCFIATAAHGTPQAPGVDALRTVRDRARRSSAFAAAAAALYERSSPPLADALRGTGHGRAAVRRALAPLVGVAELVQALLR